MGVICDTALLEKNQKFQDVIRAACMAIAYETELDLEANPGKFDEETQARRMGLIRTITAEVQGSAPESYLARVRWYSAQDAANATGVFVKNGMVQEAALDNDEAILNAVRKAFARTIRIG